MCRLACSGDASVAVHHWSRAATFPSNTDSDTERRRKRAMVGRAGVRGHSSIFLGWAAHDFIPAHQYAFIFEGKAHSTNGRAHWRRNPTPPYLLPLSATQWPCLWLLPSSPPPPPQPSSHLAGSSFPPKSRAYSSPPLTPTFPEVRLNDFGSHPPYLPCPR
jgi:hypothetical protein